MRQRHIYAAIQKAHEEKGYPIELACILTAFGSATPRFLSAMCGANRECWTDYVRRSRSLPLRLSWGQDTNAAQPFTAAALSGADRPIGAMEQYRRARVIWLPNSGILPADLLLPPGRRMAHTAFMAPMGYRNTGL